MPFLSHPTHTRDFSVLLLTRISWRRLISRFLCCEVVPRPFPHCTLWKEVTLRRPHSGVRSYTLPPQESSRHQHKLFGILLHGRFVFSPPFICLLSHSYQYGLMIYFTSKVIIPYFCILMSLWHTHINTRCYFAVCWGVGLLVLSISLLPCATRHSRLSLHVSRPSSEVGHFPRG